MEVGWLLWVRLLLKVPFGMGRSKGPAEVGRKAHRMAVKGSDPKSEPSVRTRKSFFHPERAELKCQENHKKPPVQYLPPGR